MGFLIGRNHILALYLLIISSFLQKSFGYERTRSRVHTGREDEGQLAQTSKVDTGQSVKGHARKRNIDMYLVAH